MPRSAYLIICGSCFFIFFYFKILDINECNTDVTACDDNAVCYNLLGHYECKCRAPYMGNGIKCIYEQACSTCSNNAYCDIGSENFPRCICNIGYFGNGYQCEPIRAPEGSPLMSFLLLIYFIFSSFKRCLLKLQPSR